MIVVVALLFGFLPSLIWLAFFLREDVHPEPRTLIAKVYIWGGISALAALAIEYLTQGAVNSAVITLPRIFSSNITPFIAFAAVEEVVKFAFVFMIVRKNPFFDEPVDAMIYATTGALGFAAAENFFLVLSNGFSGVFGLIVVRFVGATLLHALSSAIVGHHWARGIKYHMEAKMIFIGLVLASVFHAAFNVLVFNFSDYLIYPIALLLLVGFFVLYDFEELRQME